MAAETGVLTERIRSQTLDEGEWELLHAAAADTDSKALLSYGGDGTTPNVAEIERECARTVRRHGRLDLLVVDYLGLMHGTLGQRGSAADRQTEVAHDVSDLQGLADGLQTSGCDRRAVDPGVRTA
ncbi:DnaB-like helicase C-terminal domain-containing protein [Streptomyces bicolor]|uniref:DnaB-like helicase C-terminal domain-containing protein n=1 Tax=Streptomyces bicolor TaxID=66874 RepID=UPI0004E1129A|nr:DnaB-like helicase C-terminal domain-containing protein [Streptomyces bicolor]